MVAFPLSPKHWWQRHRHVALLVTLMVPVVVAPVLRTEGIRPGLLRFVVLVLVLGVALSTVVAGRGARTKLVVAAGIAFLAGGGEYAARGPWTRVLSDLAWGFFLITLSALLLRWALGAGRITFERIIAAICVYMCLGLLWASLYRILLVWRPEAIQFPAGVGESAVTYFSFITLTTLGYGDILPVHPLAQGLAYLEAAAGPLFMAVLIARLVALEIVHSRHGDDQKSSS